MFFSQVNFLPHEIPNFGYIQVNLNVKQVQAISTHHARFCTRNSQLVLQWSTWTRCMKWFTKNWRSNPCPQSPLYRTRNTLQKIQTVLIWVAHHLLVLEYFAWTRLIGSHILRTAAYNYISGLTSTRDLFKKNLSFHALFTWYQFFFLFLFWLRG